MEEPIFLQAACKDYLWGGDRLREEFGKQSTAEKIAETWELAAHPDGSSLICNGVAAGMALSDYLALNGGLEILGTNCAGCETLPILIKLIDAKENLSIQVHPDDAYAERTEGEPGKTEMWYIVDSTPGAAIYYGLNRAVSRSELAARIREGTILEILNRVEVSPGELYFIPAGTLHAIGGGILLVEIQQNSNSTYRVYDYDRCDADGKPRELHIEKALDVAQRTPTPPTPQFPEKPVSGGSVRKLWNCTYFASDLVAVTDNIVASVSRASFQHLLVLGGKGTLETSAGAYPIQKGNSILLPAGLGRYAVCGKCQYIVTKMDRPVR